MLCSTLKRDSPLALIDANESADLVEFRLDLSPSLKRLRKRAHIPVIFTCHEVSDELVALKPDYIDLPFSASKEQFQAIPPSIKRICSFHDFEKTPDDLDAIYEQMREKRADYYKVATFANTTLDALRMLNFIRRTNVIGVAMGELGQITRILAPILGSPWTYAPTSLDQKTAKGQMSIAELKGIYHTHLHTSQTALYGLIGDPVLQSLSHRTHNFVFEHFGIDAVYVKMLIEKGELTEALPLLEKIGFRGLSITMPHKEAIFPSPTNTLTFSKGAVGSNTDGLGALDALERKISVRGKEIAILGAGGSAKAIVSEAQKRGAKAHLYHRCFPKTTSYDILINATPADLKLDPPSSALVMDLRVSEEKSPFLMRAEEKGCVTIEGVEMFKHQAIYQFEQWFS
ncbi:MAG: Shikimate dehydrogenase (NADP(+)) [Chlamydiales bacterium]|nr:Shikimate dehydrogenase (NADP(+)) [Chlamydiales bacterium]MCH9619992.1 Shikimate dehydrogenase (NADP(+)) [Chlamydiales bacterium]MCH9622904.1 Shikimate dehydrogenase (NADP(+)) [Chlamydiales bacterium]